MTRNALSVRTHIALLIAIALLVSLAGCGGGLNRSSFIAPIDEYLFTPNYVSDLDGNLFHWNRLPVKFAFDLPNNWQELYPSDPSLHIEAANGWNQPDRQALVQVVATLSQADVIVYFVAQSEIGGRNLGLTEFTYDSTGRMRSASIQIALDYPPPRRAQLSANDMSSVIAHEIGHALGIGGHSPYSEDLMYATQMPDTLNTPTIRDFNTVMTAYPGYYDPDFTPETRSVPAEPVEIFTRVIHCDMTGCCEVLSTSEVE